MQTLRFEPSLFVEPCAKADHFPVKYRKGVKQGSDKRGKIHALPPIVLRLLSRRETGPKCLDISAMARSVAPRLPSTRFLAFSPTFFIRSGLRKTSLQATPTSSGLSTWTAASAVRKREAISAKFSIEGPKTGILPKAAGSKILCPPEGTSEPPTNTPSA